MEPLDFQNVEEKWHRITALLVQRGQTITVMESCTSGLMASFITDCEGSSAAFKGGYVTYSNEAKIAAGVSDQVIRVYGVYSHECACAMAHAARAAFAADVSVGVTGSFGNADPANADSVPGEVYFAIEAAAHVLRAANVNAAGKSAAANAANVTVKSSVAIGESGEMGDGTAVDGTADAGTADGAVGNIPLAHVIGVHSYGEGAVSREDDPFVAVRHVTLPPLATRFAYKLAMADCIADALLAVLA